MKILLLPFVSVTPAWYPMPMFLVPVLLNNALLPIAVLLLPSMLFTNAFQPLAVFPDPAVL
jgi:hypothetical protein